MPNRQPRSHAFWVSHQSWLLLLITRGYDDESSARSFLTPKLQPNSRTFSHARNARSRCTSGTAIDNGEPILIYGDYDVDGTTGTAVLLRALKLLGARTGFHVPHRFTEGYGIQQPASERR